ncbi:hypothetical protein HPE56_02895 [Maribacter sp. ANRC-HE7]|uniref:Uncharacterized protein n=1 Tax=Maribacter aquimaris TaxID=2737171 RepID=A0ABR7UW82_9FLAO|nr:hypothetical protein [Maribacter aquimaris]MBD0776730.1 hypothetical protein [Maribacter aquimaris]
MVSQKKITKKVLSERVEQMYRESQQWKSYLQLVFDELTFIQHLLNSYVFEPNTPNLFERLQNYQTRIKKSKDDWNTLSKQVVGHENNIGGILECSDRTCDKFYHQKHEVLKAETVSYLESFKDLKSEIFEYAGGILKKNKPNK